MKKALLLGLLSFALARSVPAGILTPRGHDWLRPPDHVYVLAIGIDRHPDDRVLPPLRGCVRDARGIADVCRRVFGASPDRTLVLENQAATKENIRHGLQKWALSAGAADMVVVLFSGYAFTRGTAGSRENYLIPFDARAKAGCGGPGKDFDDCFSTDSLVGSSLLYSWLKQVGATRQIVLLDSRSTDQALPFFEAHWRKEACEVGPESMKRIVMVTNHGFGLERDFNGETQGLLTKAVSDALTQTPPNGLVTAFGVQQAIYRLWGQISTTRDEDGDGDANEITQDTERREQVRVDLLGGDFVVKAPPGKPVEARQLLLDSGLGPVCYNADEAASRGFGTGVEAAKEAGAARDASPRNYALVVATDEYANWPRLSNPVLDATTIENHLRARYGFETEHLFNPTRTELRKKLDELHARKFTNDDQLLIFIAGHGDYDEINDTGYLVFKDSAAGHDYDSDMALMDLRQRIDTIPAPHILLVMDSCFAGSLDPDIGGASSRGDPYEQISLEALRKRSADKKTRTFLTSGSKEYVPDGRPGQHSPFAALFINALQKSDVPDGYLSLAKLPQYFQRLRTTARMGNLGHNEAGSEFFLVPLPRR